MMTTTAPVVSAIPAETYEGSSVLVGIVTHNRAEIVPKAIRSAYSQVYPKIQISVVDDASSDETPSLSEKYRNARWLRWDSVRGYLEARNLLMRTARAEYYLSLDDDAWFMGQDEVAVAVEHLERNPHVAAVAFDILTPDRPYPVARTEARPVSMFIGCGHLLRTSAAREAGFYEPNPGAYGSEERDLCIRLLDKNHEIHLLPGVHVWHDKTQVARDLPAQHRSGVCNDLVFAMRRCPMPMLLVVLPLKVVNHLRFAVGMRLIRPCVSGIGLFLRSCGKVWRSRKPVRAGVFAEFLRRSRQEF